MTQKTPHIIVARASNIDLFDQVAPGVFDAPIDPAPRLPRRAESLHRAGSARRAGRGPATSPEVNDRSHAHMFQSRQPATCAYVKQTPRSAAAVA